ncbi:MAG: MBL fold metallo-hydrolase [Kiritimatiellia bacterium]
MLKALSLSQMHNWSSALPPGELRLWSGRLRGNNLGYFVQVDARRVIAVDVPDGERMLSLLEERGWELHLLLLTHTHHDHVVNLEKLVEWTGCAFWYPEGADLSVPGSPMRDGEEREALGLRIQAMDTSGHSPLDFSYFFPELPLCFCGDTLFAWGCGRMFTGPAERFWSSLRRLRGLPDETLLCCGHDYFAENSQFLRTFLPQLPEFFPGEGEGEMPLRLGEQKLRNPFLRADDPRVAAALDLAPGEPVEVFKKLRELRNQL